MSLETPTSDLAALEMAEQRLEKLERKVYGNVNKYGDIKDEFSTPLVPKLSGMSQEIGDAIGRRERIVPLFRKLNELEKYLEPSSAVETGMSLTARAELILSEENQIRNTNDMLERVKDTKAVLDSQAIKDVSSLEGQMAKLTKIQIEQNQKGDQLSEESLELIGQYNDIVEALTSTFMEYDKLLTAAEEAAKTK